MISYSEFDRLTEEEMEPWLEMATNKLIDSTRLPLSDDVWATDKYAEIIFDTAKELYEDFTSEKKD